ncbi:MAG: gephyrin-like molybdotransferase Glp [Oscillochloridaceae bacterium umkhey_bin13]
MNELVRESPYPTVPISTAQDLIMAQIQPLGTERVALHAAAGRILAAPLLASFAIPDLPKAAMDGYALRSTDGLAPRRVIAELTAGREPGLQIVSGTAARIMTGAPMPAGADTMVPVEQTQETDGIVTLATAPTPGQYVHTIGQDVAADSEVLPAGIPLGSAEIGLLATFGQTEVTVFRQPVVAVLATGDEVIEPGAARPAGAVYDSNRFALLAAVHEAGARGFSLGIAPDRPELQREAVLRGLAEADVLITSGGVSMGSRDLIKPLLAELGQVHFGRVAFKPGKPTTFATVAGKLVFGLPGFPVSSLVSFEVFVRPALRALQGDQMPWRPRVWATLNSPVQPSPDRPEYQRVTLRYAQGRLEALTTGGQGSSRLLSLLGANGLLVVPPGQTSYQPGDQLEALVTGPILA